jgi:hypothetical protein
MVNTVLVLSEIDDTDREVECTALVYRQYSFDMTHRVSGDHARGRSLRRDSGVLRDRGFRSGCGNRGEGPRAECGSSGSSLGRLPTSACDSRLLSLHVSCFLDNNSQQHWKQRRYLTVPPDYTG